MKRIYKTDLFIETVNKSLKKIREFKKKNDFDAIAFTGTSGAGLAYVLSYKLKIPLICVRKKDRSHYTKRIEGAYLSNRFLIVDDFISSGNTMKRIISSINEEYPLSKPVGIFLYSEFASSDPYWRDIPVITL